MFLMDTVISLEVYGEDTSSALAEMEEELLRLDEKFSPDNEYEDDFETNFIIDKAKEIENLTQGCFNIELGQVMRLWGFRNDDFRVPEQNDIMSARNRKVYDFGGIAKGYASDKLVEIADKYNIKSAIFSLGGNVCAIGKRKDGNNWRVAITNPENTNDYIGYVEVTDKAVVTSGGYQRFFEHEGKRYHHIIDPKTGYPADGGLLSVTVISDCGITADALSTAFFVSGKELAFELYESGKIDFEAVFVDSEGEIFSTPNAGFIRKE